jgi:Xaa-Pro aminopeptidase
MYFTSNDIEARRQRVAAAWNNLLNDDDVVLIQSGSPVAKPGGLDQTYPFLPYPAYYWLTGRRREEETLLYNKNTGWKEFQKSVAPEEAVWEGERNDLLVNSPGENISRLNAFIQERKFSSAITITSGTLRDEKTFAVRTALDRERRKKDAAEVALIRQLADIAAHGYRRIASELKSGMSEKDIQLTFEQEIIRQGAHTVPYETIVGSGTNSAILHALPTHKKIAANDAVLVDAGCDMFDYCVDITRMYYAGTPSSQQRSLYQLVLKAHQECMAMCKPGVWWRDVHLHAAKVITQGLVDLGILKGSADELMEKEVASVFFPHGVGHLVGLRVRDTGHEENVQPKTYCGARLRVDILLEENHLLTVEPGCYFIPALLNNSAIRSRFKENINWDEAQRWIPVGGVRIEDNLLITASGFDNLTAGVEKVNV